MKNQYDEDCLIVWQKWFDPFGEDDTDSGDHHLLDNDEDSQDEDNDDLYLGEHHQPNKPIRAIATPMGLIPYNENTASSKIFNFWVGHTNFSITKEIGNLLEIMDGVETLDIFTRYRFRISIGKAFDPPKVMKKINDTIYEHIENIS
jgi:hypothetical protein